MVAAAVRTVFAQPDADHVAEQFETIAMMLVAKPAANGMINNPDPAQWKPHHSTWRNPWWLSQRRSDCCVSSWQIETATISSFSTPIECEVCGAT